MKLISLLKNGSKKVVFLYVVDGFVYIVRSGNSYDLVYTFAVPITYLNTLKLYHGCTVDRRLANFLLDCKSRWSDLKVVKKYD